MKQLYFLCILAGLSCQIQSQTSLEDYLDIPYFVENSWAGEKIMVVEGDQDNEPYKLKRTIFGSGLPVISEQELTIQKLTDTFFTCQPARGEAHSPTISFAIANGQRTFYYNDKARKHRLFQEYFSSRERK